MKYRKRFIKRALRLAKDPIQVATKATRRKSTEAERQRMKKTQLAIHYGITSEQFAKLQKK